MENSKASSMETIDFKIIVNLYDGNNLISSDGTVVMLLDATGSFRAVRYVDNNGYCIATLPPGLYTILASINKAQAGVTPITAFSAKVTEVSSLKTETGIDIGKTTDKGDIKATIKVDGLFAPGVPVTVTKGSFRYVVLTDNLGEASFINIQGGFYNVTAEVDTVCNGAQKHQSKTQPANLPPDQMINFDFWSCP